MASMSLIFTFVLWVLIGTMASYLANQRGRDPYIWFFIGILLGLLGVLLVFLLPPVIASKEEKTVVPNTPSSTIVTNESSVVSTEWFCLDKTRKQQGPIAIGILRELWKKGNIDAKSYVWSEGMSGWKRIEELIPLLQALQEDI